MSIEIKVRREKSVNGIIESSGIITITEEDIIELAKEKQDQSMFTNTEYLNFRIDEVKQ